MSRSRLMPIFRAAVDACAQIGPDDVVGSQQRTMAAIRADLEWLDANLAAALVAMASEFNGIPSSGGGNGPSSTVPDPVSNAALRPEPVIADRVRLAEAIGVADQGLRLVASKPPEDRCKWGFHLIVIEQACHTVRTIATRYRPRSATPADARRSADGEPGCQSCSRARVNNRPAWSPVARNVKMPDGSRIPLCEWCRTWVREHGAIPNRSALNAHHAGQRVKR